MFYYWSANISKVIYWIAVFENKIGPTWALMDTLCNPKVSPISILSSPLPVGTMKYFNNLVIKKLSPNITSIQKTF